MKHTSVKLDSPIEFIESSAISPFISKVQIKVCYVGDQPNRNRSIITKETARKMAPSLRGCPIVGFFNENKGDFEEHNRQINISNGEWKITDTTVPYGFVDLNAKIWFASYLDDDENEHEYLCTEGYVWDNAYPEAKRLITKGNNHSMELDEKTLDATWSKDKNGRPEFFIINEALLSKLCILGEDAEPCFEGSQITAFSLVIDESFQNKLFSMMNEIKNLITEGGTKVFKTYAVEIGDALWSALYSYIQDTFPGEERWCSKYTIDGVFEEGGQKFAVLLNRAEMKYYRLNFSITDADGFKAEETLVEVTKSYTPAAEPQFSAAEVETYVNEYVKKKEEDEKKEKEEDAPPADEGDKQEAEDSSEDDEEEEEEDKKKKKNFAEETCPKCGKPLDECVCDKEKEYSLNDIPEYVELNTNYGILLDSYNALKANYDKLNEEITPLREFKAAAERKEKEEMISRFYMLSDEDKADVVTNIDTYSLEDIEAKLSVICVRNKVSFAEDTNESNQNDPTTFSLDDINNDDLTPAWVKAALNVAKSLEN